MFKAVLFDLDNTLIDFMRMKEESVNAAIAAMIDAGLDMSEEEIKKRIYKIYEGNNIEDQHVFQKLLKQNGEIDYRILGRGINAYRSMRSGLLTPYPKTKSTLIQLKEKGLKLAIVSDAPRLKAWLRLTALKLDDFFDLVITYDDTKELKPSSIPFKKALEALNLKPEECLMVGDNSERDIKGAQALGIKTIWAKYGATTKEATKADFEIDSIEELIKIVS